MATTTPANASASYKAEVATIAREALYPVTSEETSNGIAIADYSYPVGNILRYGADPTGTSDSTTKIQAAFDIIYDQGGGTVFIPLGTFLVSTIVKAFAANRSVNIKGECEQGSTLEKFGSGTDPILDITTTSAIITSGAIYSDFKIAGNNYLHDGLRITKHARFTIRNLYMYNCDSAIHLRGSLICAIYDTNLHTNNRGYKTASNGGIYCNNINVYGGGVQSNIKHGFDLGHANGINVDGCQIELNGTTTDLTTGGVVTRSTCDDESSFSIISFSNCWFEDNKGMAFTAEDCAGLVLAIRNCPMIESESGNVADIGIIRSLRLEDVVASAGGANPDTITSQAAAGIVSGGIINTYTDAAYKTAITSHAYSGGLWLSKVNSMRLQSESGNNIIVYLGTGSDLRVSDGTAYVVDVTAA